MCLGIPGQVVRMLEGYGDQLALVDVSGENRKVNIGMLLEDQFGVQLFYRTAKGVELTPAGNVMLTHARAMLESLKAHPVLASFDFGLMHGRMKASETVRRVRVEGSSRVSRANPNSGSEYRGTSPATRASAKPRWAAME